MIGLRLLIGKPSPRDDPESIEPKHMMPSDTILV